MHPSYNAHALRLYFRLCYLVVVGLSWTYVWNAPTGDVGSRTFAFVVLLTYAALYLLPAAALTCAVGLLTSVGPLRSLRVGATSATALLATWLTGVALLVDRRVWELFGFHLNGFVWNLIVTPGGLESLESSASARRGAILRIGGLLLLQAAVLAAALAWSRRGAAGGTPGPRRPAARRRALALLGCWLLLMVVQTLAYAFSQLHGHVPVVVAAASFPAYQPLTIRHLAERWGFAPEGDAGVELERPALALEYPLADVRIDDSHPRPNLVWLCVESLRADALEREIMPETWSLAERGIVFERHYSSGNATRMGTFGMFYGLYASYWFAMLAERRPPLLLDVLRRRGYRIEAWTSAHFTYPEFDKTIFAGLAPGSLHEKRDDLEPHENDRWIVRDLERFLDEDRGVTPFFAFLFFDATHARYTFRESSVIRSPYADDIDYVTMKVGGDVAPIRNRYWNACRDVDGRIGEVVGLLESRGLFEETILVVTGDHGQEFQEHGRWGHNSAFNDVQLRVPLVLRLPGEAPRRVARLTSHLDLPPTLLPRLGARIAERDHCLGRDLLGVDAHDWVVAGSWSELALIDSEVKITLPFRGAFAFGTSVTAEGDEPAADPSRWLAERSPALAEIAVGMGRFARRR